MESTRRDHISPADDLAMNHWDIFLDDVLRLGVAAVLGGALGLEREWKGHWAGLRTHMMVSIGAAVFMIAGLDVVGDEHAEQLTRIVQGVATGIGFLGAGTILKLSDRREIKGLTTAASIWLAAALGTVAGLAQFALAAAVVCVSLFILGVLGPIERQFERRQTEHRRERERTDHDRANRNKLHD